jgi:antibiotic biosynthesis monooxygenase (ABM) superfamily enzyme
VPRGILVVRSRPVSPEREDEYNDWYSGVHVTELLAVPGFVSARRFRRVGEGDGHEYLAVYEVEADDLAAPLHELRRRSAAGETTRSDAIQPDPPPEIVLYEALD